MKSNRVGEPHDARHGTIAAAEAVLWQLAEVCFPPKQDSPRFLLDLVTQFALQPIGDDEWPAVAAHYRILVEQIPAVVFMAFLDKGVGEAFVSPQVEELLGFTQEEWLRNPIRLYQQLHPDDRARWSLEAARTLMTGEPLRSVYRVLARDGRVVWFHCEVKMVRHADGRPWFFHGVGFDITDLKITEEALGKSEEMLRGIFESAPDTMVVIDREGRVDRVNAQVERMFGYRPDELVGQPAELLLADHHRPRFAAIRAGFMTDRPSWPSGTGIVLGGRREDGSDVPVEITLSSIDAPTGPLLIAVFRDVTRRQRDEQALREYAEYLKVLSRRFIEVQEAERRRIALELHDEIGQILTGLKFKLEIGARLPADEAQARLIEAQELVNDLMARTRKLSLDLRPATLDHLGLLPALFMHIRRYTSQTQIRVDFKHSGVEGRRFGPDPETAAFRVVQEALTNVARHSGAVEVIVRVWADDHALMVQIEDHGCGFEHEVVMRGGASTGLLGMRERALLLGGQFSIESSPETGTSVTARWEMP